MRDVAVIGLGMHPWGKFKDPSVTDLCRIAVQAALKDAGVSWPESQAVSAATSRSRARRSRPAAGRRRPRAAGL